jgi:hypothetical protein
MRQEENNNSALRLLCGPCREATRGKMTVLSSLQRGCAIITNPQLSEDNFKKKEKDNWSQEER